MSRLERIEPQAVAFEAAMARGRLHHAWLLTGPEGVGKASFAWRAAARLLGAPDLEDHPDHPAVRLMTAGSHPDFVTLTLEARDRSGTMRREITVDQARRLPEFFSKAPALGRYRVAIIDAADDLNVNAANAVLKTLEEPSGSGVLFLVSHAPGRLLPTIRSRCRRLRFDPWPTESIVGFLKQRGLDPALAQNAGGSPGKALALAEDGGAKREADMELLIDSHGVDRLKAMQAIVDDLRGEAGRARFDRLMERLAATVRERAVNAGANGDGWAATWRRLGAISGQVDGLNIDRADALSAALAEIDRAGRAA